MGVLYEDGGVGPEAGDSVVPEAGGVLQEAGILHEDGGIGREAGILHEDGGIGRKAGVLHEDGSVSCDVVACGAGIGGSAGVVC